MATTITIDPVNRIEGHLKATVAVENDGTVSSADLTGTMFRGMELILNRRDPRDAPVITQRICGVCPTAHAISSVRCLENAFGLNEDPGTGTSAGDISAGGNYLIPKNGRIIQNIINGCDTVMSHILHLYHLSALDYVDASILGAPWSPTYSTGDMLPVTGVNDSTTGNALVNSYVKALEMRRKMHTAGALFSGRQPIQNALVPGGVTTMYSTTSPAVSTMTGATDIYGPFNATETKAKFIDLLRTVREFINQRYIPDVLTVAAAYGSGAFGNVSGGWFTQGVGCKRFLSYGDYPDDSTGKKLALKRGVVDWSGSVNTTVIPFNQNHVVEFVNHSYFKYGVLDAEDGLHPYDGKTIPALDAGVKYSWLKAPRYKINGGDPKVVEVGPISRLIVSYCANDNAITADDSDTAAGGVRFNGSYNVRQLVNYGLSAALGAPSTSDVSTSALDLLPSVLGRHAARALEAKFLADSLHKWVNQLDNNGQCYTYARVPKSIKTGFGLVEVPRGSLGHWIKIEGRKIAKYQCVVPTTWNASPKDTLALPQPGPAEQALLDSNVGTTNEEMILNILRVLHPFDFCIACAVHVVTPEGKEKLKFAIGPDGRPANIEIKE